MEENNMEQRILDAAGRLFYRQGYANTSTVQIAQEVGCNQALIHYYFRTKENLFRRIFTDQVTSAWQVISRSIEPNTTTEQLITHCVNMYFESLNNHRELPFFVLQELVLNESRRQYIRKSLVQTPMFSMLLMQLSAILRKDQEAGRIINIDPMDLVLNIASAVVFTFISLPMYKDIFNRTSIEVDAYIEHRKQEIIRMLISSLRP